MKTFIYLLLFLFIFQSCDDASPKSILDFTNDEQKNVEGKEDTLIHKEGITIEDRFQVPAGYERIEHSVNSFGKYLRQLPLKVAGSRVLFFDGNPKEKENVYDAVIDLPIGSKDLHQCADAVMRLRAEYLWNQKRFEEIHFNLTNGFRVDYSEWMKGKRIIVKGNKTYWSQSTAASNTYKDFWKYMELVFTYAGTLSLSKELKVIDIKDLEIGDVFIRGGSPGHAVIVVDVAINPENQKKLFLLAQSYMPAQEIQLLKNPNNKSISPWYSADFGGELQTPEWVFTKDELKRF